MNANTRWLGGFGGWVYVSPTAGRRHHQAIHTKPGEYGLALAACTSTPADTTGPAILSRTPSIGAENVSVKSPIPLVFSEPVLASSLSDSSVVLAATGPVKVRLDKNGNVWLCCVNFTQVQTLTHLQETHVRRLNQ